MRPYLNDIHIKGIGPNYTGPINNTCTCCENVMCKLSRSGKQQQEQTSANRVQVLFLGQVELIGCVRESVTRHKRGGSEIPFAEVI